MCTGNKKIIGSVIKYISLPYRQFISEMGEINTASAPFISLIVSCYGVYLEIKKDPPLLSISVFVEITITERKMQIRRNDGRGTNTRFAKSWKNSSHYNRILE